MIPSWEWLGAAGLLLFDMALRVLATALLSRRVLLVRSGIGGAGGDVVLSAIHCRNKLTASQSR
jgi:hypothetical protein